MAFEGMDVDALTGVHTQLTNLSQQLESLISSIGREVSNAGANWKGADSTHFESEWTGTHRIQLNNAKTAIDTFNSTLMTNINQQIQASA